MELKYWKKGDLNQRKFGGKLFLNKEHQREREGDILKLRKF